MVPFVRKSIVLRLVGFALLFVAACANQSTTSQPTASAAPDIKAIPITLPISINEVMVAAVDHAAHEIWNAPIKEKAPKNDKDWMELEHHALQLVASSRTILLAGTGKADAGWVQAPDWKKYAQALTDASTASVKAVREKNMDALNTAGDQLVMVCEGCHKVFKPEIPSEGKLHPHYR
jgi:hypothetical protein